VVGTFVGVGDDWATGANADLKPPNVEEDPNAGKPDGADGPGGVIAGFEKTETRGGVLVSAALKKGEVVGVVTLPKAPNPSAGLNAEGVVVRLPKAPVPGVLLVTKGEGAGGLSLSETMYAFARGDASGEDDGELGMGTGVWGVGSGLALRGFSRKAGWLPNTEPPLEDEPPLKADPPLKGDVTVASGAKGDFGFAGVVAVNGEFEVPVVLCWEAFANVAGGPANAPNPPVDGVNNAVGGEAAEPLPLPVCCRTPPNVVGVADANPPNPPLVDVVLAETTGFPNEDWPNADWPNAGLPNDDWPKEDWPKAEDGGVVVFPNAEGDAVLGLAGSLLLPDIVWAGGKLLNAPNPAAGFIVPPKADAVAGAGGGDGSAPNIPGLFDFEGPSLLSPSPRESPPNEGVASDIEASRNMSGAGEGEATVVDAGVGVELTDDVPNPKLACPNAFVAPEAELNAPKAPVVDEEPPNALGVGAPNAPDEPPPNAEPPPPNADVVAGLLLDVFAKADVGWEVCPNIDPDCGPNGVGEVDDVPKAEAWLAPPKPVGEGDCPKADVEDCPKADVVPVWPKADAGCCPKLDVPNADAWPNADVDGCFPNADGWPKEDCPKADGVLCCPKADAWPKVDVCGDVEATWPNAEEVAGWLPNPEVWGDVEAAWPKAEEPAAWPKAGEDVGAGEFAEVAMPRYGFECSTYHPCKVPSFRYAYITGAPVLESVRSASRERSTVSSIDLSRGRVRGFSWDCWCHWLPELPNTSRSTEDLSPTTSKFFVSVVDPSSSHFGKMSVNACWYKRSGIGNGWVGATYVAVDDLMSSDMIWCVGSDAFAMGGA
jgi:hypothetical protein